MPVLTIDEIDADLRTAFAAQRGDKAAQWTMIQKFMTMKKHEWLRVLDTINQCKRYGIMTFDEAKAIVGGDDMSIPPNTEPFVEEIKRRLGIFDGGKNE